VWRLPHAKDVLIALLAIYQGRWSSSPYSIRHPVRKVGWTPRPDNGLFQKFRSRQGLGADEVFDYRYEGVVEKIRAATGNALNIAIDTISEARRLSRSPAPLGTRMEKSPSSFAMRVPVQPLQLPSACLLTCFGVYDWCDLSLLCRSSDPFLGIKRQVVRRSIQKDPRYRERQAYPGFHTTQWNCWSEGRSAVHAGWKGKSDLMRLVAVYRDVF
jgi:hypothetical protein